MTATLRTRNLRRALSLVLGAAALGACEERVAQSADALQKDPWLFSDYPAPTPVSRDSMVSFSLVEKRRYGTDDGLGALDIVSQLAVTDSVLVALLYRNCELVVFSRSTSKALRRFGKCGQGPDDFWDMAQGAISTKGDTLLVFDMLGRRARLISMSGKVFRAFLLDSALVPAGTRVTTARALSDTTVLLGLTLPAHQRRGDSLLLRLPTAEFLRRARFDTWRSTDATLRDGPAIAQHVSNRERTPISCVVGSPVSRQSLVMFNRWEPQLIAAPSSDLHRASMNRLLPISFPSRTTVPDKRGLIQTTAMSEIACGDSAALLSRRPVNATNAPPANAELFAYWPATSRIGHATLDESNGAALGRFAVGHRSRFFAIHNTKYAYPLIVEMELIIDDKTGATASQRPSIAP